MSKQLQARVGWRFLPPGLSQRLPVAPGIPCVLLPFEKSLAGPGALASAWVSGMQFGTAALSCCSLTHQRCERGAQGRVGELRHPERRRRRGSCGVVQGRAAAAC